MGKIIFLLAFCFFCISSFSQKRDLPLIVEKMENSDYLVFHITGDGGWRGFDLKLGNELKTRQISYVFLNAFKYFWSSKTPDQLASDLVPVIREYLKKWDKKELVLTGFSFGAEVLPFLVSRLPDDIKKKVRLVVLITPASTSDFSIHLTDMVGVDHKYAYNVVNELESIKLTKVLAIFGEKEESTFPKNHHQDNFKMVFVKGSHHFTDAKSVMTEIWKDLK